MYRGALKPSTPISLTYECTALTRIAGTIYLLFEAQQDADTRTVFFKHRERRSNCAPFFVVWPLDGTDGAQVAAIARQLRKFVQDSSDFYASTTKNFGLNFWMLPLNETSLNDVRNIANVRLQICFGLSH